MSNAYFQFKQFRIAQDRCAMKVSTDACIQGAWTPMATGAKRVLDIGTGTGLLSLMMAQRAPDAVIDAIELNAAAASQARENIANSKFQGRIHVITGDAAQWLPPYCYDLIISNPPFFKNALQGPDDSRNAARHVRTLDGETLIRLSLRLLAPDGGASFLWPRKEAEIFAETAEQNGLYLHRKLHIRHRAGSTVTRVAGIFGKTQPHTCTCDTLTIKDEAEQYTAAFATLLRPFYLHL